MHVENARLGVETTRAQRNTHVSMSLKRTGFANRDAVPRVAAVERALDLEIDVRERPELLGRIAGDDGATTQHVGRGADQILCCAADDVAQRGLALASSLVAD